jgi:hypothetical protein
VPLKEELNITTITIARQTVFTGKKQKDVNETFVFGLKDYVLT